MADPVAPDVVVVTHPISIGPQTVDEKVNRAQQRIKRLQQAIADGDTRESLKEELAALTYELKKRGVA